MLRPLSYCVYPYKTDDHETRQFFSQTKPNDERFISRVSTRNPFDPPDSSFFHSLLASQRPTFQFWNDQLHYFTAEVGPAGSINLTFARWRDVFSKSPSSLQRSELQRASSPRVIFKRPTNPKLIQTWMPKIYYGRWSQLRWSVYWKGRASQWSEQVPIVASRNGSVSMV